jgi:hypothetical protein
MNTKNDKQETDGALALNFLAMVVLGFGLAAVVLAVFGVVASERANEVAFGCMGMALLLMGFVHKTLSDLSDKPHSA